MNDVPARPVRSRLPLAVVAAVACALVLASVANAGPNRRPMVIDLLGAALAWIG